MAFSAREFAAVSVISRALVDFAPLEIFSASPWILVSALQQQQLLLRQQKQRLQQLQLPQLRQRQARQVQQQLRRQRRLQIVTTQIVKTNATAFSAQKSEAVFAILMGFVDSALLEIYSANLWILVLAKQQQQQPQQQQHQLLQRRPQRQPQHRPQQQLRLQRRRQQVKIFFYINSRFS